MIKITRTAEATQEVTARIKNDSPAIIGTDFESLFASRNENKTPLAYLQSHQFTTYSDQITPYLTGNNIIKDLSDILAAFDDFPNEASDFTAPVTIRLKQEGIEAPYYELELRFIHTGDLIPPYVIEFFIAKDPQITLETVEV